MALGRPPLYTGRVKRHMLHLIRKYNISQAMDILNALPGTSLAMLRNTNIVPEPLGVSYPTLLKYAREYGIKKKRGHARGQASDGSRKAQREHLTWKRPQKYQVV